MQDLSQPVYLLLIQCELLNFVDPANAADSLLP